MNFDDALKCHLDALKLQDFSPRTIHNRRHNLQGFGRFLAGLGVSKPTHVTPSILERYRSHLFEHRHDGRPLGLSTQIQKLSAVHCLFQTLVERGEVLVNVADKLTLPNKPQRLPKRLPAAKEVERMLARMPLKTPLQFRDRCVLETFYATGIRQAELAALKRSSADLERKSLHVIGKGLKDRTLPLTSRCADCLREYLAKVRPLLAPGKFLFPSKSGRKLDETILLSIAKQAAVRANVRKPVGTHTFRHVLATELLRNGANLRSIQEYLGHKSIETTTIYAHVLGKDLKKVHERTHPKERLTHGLQR